MSIGSVPGDSGLTFVVAAVVAIVGIALMCGLPAGLYVWTIRVIAESCR